MPQTLSIVADGFSKYDVEDGGTASTALVAVFVVVFVGCVVAWALWSRRRR